MNRYIFPLLILMIASCTQDTAVQNEVAQHSQQDDALIAKYRKSVRLAGFYIADPNDPSTLEEGLTAVSLSAFRQKTTLYPNGKLATLPVSAISQQYQSVIKENAGDPRLRQFRRETAEALLARSELMPAADQAYFTNELITNRSDDVALIRKSVLAIRGKISPLQQEQLVRQTKTLLNQYEKSFSADLAKYEAMQGTTFRQKSTYAINVEFAKQGLALVQENQALLATN